MDKNNENNNDVVISRIINAPVEKVWKAWTDSEQMKKWWGPKGFTSPVNDIDLRVGGKYLNCMRSPDNRDFWSTGAYIEISPMQKLVMIDSFADEEGNPVPAMYYGMSEEWPMSTEVEVDFEDDGEGDTILTVRQSEVPKEDKEKCAQGWNESLDKLVDVLEG